MPSEINTTGIIEEHQQDALSSLISMLGHDSWIKRKNSALKIAEFGESAINDLKECLSSPNEDIRFWAMVSLAKINTTNSMEPLFRLSKLDDHHIREYVAVALGYSDSKESTKILINMLDDPHWRVSNSAVNSLAMKGRVVIEDLIEALKKSSYNSAYWLTKALSKLGKEGNEVLIAFSRFKSKKVRLLVSEALGDSNDERAIKALLKCLKDEYWQVRNNAVDSLVKMGGRAIEPLIFFMKDEKENMQPYVEIIFKRLGDYRIHPLIELLKHENQEIRSLSAEALGSTGSSKAVKPLIEALNDKIWSVRKSVAKALAKIGEVAVDDLIKSLSCEDDNVRYWIAIILGTIGESAIEPLGSMLSSSDKEYRLYAAQALGKIRDERVVMLLIEALQDEAWIVRNSVAESLMELGDISLIPIMKSLMSQNEDRRYWSKKVMERIGPEELDTIQDILIKSRDSEMRYFAAYTLSLIGNDSSLPHLISSALNDPNEWVRKYSISAISRINNPKSVDTLIKLLYDDDEEIAYWSAKSFANIGEIASERLRSLLDEKDKNIRNLIILALGGIGDEKSMRFLIEKLSSTGLEAQRCIKVLVASEEKAIPYLIEALADQRIEVRENSAKALEALGIKAIEPLLQAMESENEEQRYWAGKILRNIKKGNRKHE